MSVVNFFVLYVSIAVVLQVSHDTFIFFYLAYYVINRCTVVIWCINIICINSFWIESHTGVLLDIKH